MVTEFSDRSGGPAGGERVEADGEVAVLAGVDVSTTGEDLADQGVGLVVGTGVAGVVRISLARVVAVLKAALRMAWVSSFVSVSRTCCPRAPPGPGAPRALPVLVRWRRGPR